MWTGLRIITYYQRKTTNAEKISASLTDEVNNSLAEEVQKAQDPCPLVISTADVCRSINPRKASGSDRISGQALKVCRSTSRCLSLRELVKFQKTWMSYAAESGRLEKQYM